MNAAGISKIVSKKELRKAVTGTLNSFSTAESNAFLTTLKQYFGFDSFRYGQKEACEAIVNAKKDVTVFCSTGSGKSLCYQLPALMLQQPVVIVSPLISLMQDQVIKINNTIGLGEKELACYLGSAQLNLSIEEKALQGDYLFIYVTPEKLISDGFMDRLPNNIALLAVDEAHCICEWGIDFRKEYMQLSMFRMKFPNIPIMALTATAGPAERLEIAKNLKLATPVMIEGSLDRSNLKLFVRPKIASNTLTDYFSPLIDQLRAKKDYSTIVYVRTRKESTELQDFFRAHLPELGVSSYHAGMDNDVRHRVHVDFLTGKIPLVIATIAFGMGIDKPDIRCIVHYGPPKTLGEYYQQIGRAGRDGIDALCMMICSPAEFTNYKSDFYLGTLSGPQKQRMIAQIDQFRDFTLNTTDCRRHLILNYFQQPVTTDRCGVCDNCINMIAYGEDIERDFTTESKIVLKAVAGTTSIGLKFGIGKLMDVIGGSFKAQYHKSHIEDLMHDIDELKKTLKVKSKEYLKPFFALLHQKGFLNTTAAQVNIPGSQITRTYEFFSLTPTGQQFLTESRVILLPVPASLRELELKRKQATAKRIQEMKENGIDIHAIPAIELEEGCGPVLQAFQLWIRSMNHYQKTGKQEYANQLQQLLDSILTWRKQIAEQLSMAPASVLPEHLTRQIAYSRPTELEAFHQLGVKIKHVNGLCKIVQDWCDLHEPKRSMIDRGDDLSPRMILPSGIFQPHPWAEQKPSGKKQVNWLLSYERFLRGEHPQAIAVNQASGRALKESTILGHLMTALIHGKPLDLHRVMQVGQWELMTKKRWDSISRAFNLLNVNVITDTKFMQKDVLRELLKDENVQVDMDNDIKSAEQKALESKGYADIRMYMHLVRAQVPITFDDPSTKKRCFDSNL